MDGGNAHWATQDVEEEEQGNDCDVGRLPWAVHSGADSGGLRQIHHVEKQSVRVVAAFPGELGDCTSARSANHGLVVSGEHR